LPGSRGEFKRLTSIYVCTSYSGRSKKETYISVEENRMEQSYQKGTRIETNDRRSAERQYTFVWEGRDTNLVLLSRLVARNQQNSSIPFFFLFSDVPLRS